MTKDPETLLRNASSANDLVSEYCMNQLLFLPNTGGKPDLSGLEALRDDQSRDPTVRILAYETILKWSGEFTNTVRLPEDLADDGGYDNILWQETAISTNSDAEYDWLLHVITTTHYADNNHLTLLLERLFDFQNKRLETIRFLTNQVLNVNTPLSDRFEMCLRLLEPKLFTSDARAEPDKDPGVQMISSTLAALLKDKEPNLRHLAIEDLYETGWKKQALNDAIAAGEDQRFFDAMVKFTQEPQGYEGTNGLTKP